MIRAFDLAVALTFAARAACAGVSPPPKRVMHTPVVRVGPSDIARLEHDALIEDHASLAEPPPATDGTDE